MFCLGGRHFSAAGLLDGGQYPRQIGRIGYGQVVRGQQQRGAQRRHLLYRRFISIKIGFWTKEEDWAGIIHVAGEEQFVLRVPQRDGVGGVARRCNYLQDAPAEIDL